MKPNVVLVLVLVLAVVTAPGTVCRASRTTPAKCDPVALHPCAPAILWGEAPSTACCTELQAQKRCLCRYAKNPDLRKYIESQNSKKVAAACSVQVPRC
uniref:Bifunctional inhibitor/plant lipid transfer protein/seed storage helical domain-containing protein n=1 Tax=Oryza punctata TaxID=4537 RepID=A0A0E0JMP8_ORYPU